MNTESLIQKWGAVIDHGDLPTIKDSHKRAVLAQLLENQEYDSRQQAIGSGGYRAPGLLGEAAPTNAMGACLS